VCAASPATGSAYFADNLNRVLEDEGLPIRIDEGQWRLSIESKADRVLIDVLADVGEVASCTQGDPQVEIVSASVHDRLDKDGVTIVDYGAGLGRVGDGLTASSHFARAAFVAVDEPIHPDLKTFVEALPNGRVMGRSEFLSKPPPADVILMVNTLHHVPFGELGMQLGIVLAALKADGVLVIHELGEFPKPEKMNVPWVEADISALFLGDDFSVNPRVAKSRSGRSLPHVHVRLARERDPSDLKKAIDANAAKVWQTMKDRTLAEIRRLYAGPASGDSQAPVQLRTALVVNANLDLNRP